MPKNKLVSRSSSPQTEAGWTHRAQTQASERDLPRVLDSLVSTKLHPARALPSLVQRPRLLERLAPQPGQRLALLSAPAGFGKSTLLHDWAARQARAGCPVAWVTLDEGDNDPVQFLSYLVAALRRVGAERFGEGVLAALHAPEPPRMEALLSAFVNELAALPAQAALVLDDYHLIDSDVVHRIVTFLVHHLPENVQLVLSSRVDPSLPLARLRARGHLTELHAADLRFTPEETAVFLKEVMGLDLSAADATALDGLTEGWIAALHLAALSMREHTDVSRFVNSFSGSHRDIFDFLAEEVLAGQPAHVQSFVVDTSILDRLSGPLCDALTGRSDGQLMLERLDRENLLVVPLDDERCWYRYHHLFADFLRACLERERHARVAPLHLHACAWYEAHGHIAEAIRHALTAGDHERAAELMERGVGQTWYRGEVVTLLGWLGKLPDMVLRRRPMLLVWYAAALLLTGRLDSVEALLEQADHALVGCHGTDDPTHMQATTAAVRSLYARRVGDAPQAVAHARQALELLPADNVDPRPFAVISLAQAYEAAGDREATIAAYAEAGAVGVAAGHDYIALSAMAAQAHQQLAWGRLREADDVLRRALAFAAEREAEHLPAVGSVQVGLGELHYEWDDLQAAEQSLANGVALAGRTGDVEILMWGYIALSQVRLAQRDADGAVAAAREAERVAYSSGTNDARVDAAAWKARLYLRRGELAAAAAEHDRAARVGDVRTFSRALEQLGLARLWIARHEPGAALRLLAQLGETAPTQRRTIQVLALQALALQISGEHERAVGTLAHALALAEPEGYVRTFVDEGPAMADLLSAAVELRQRGRLDPRVPAHYIRKLLAALERDAPDAAPPASVLPEPLSEREREVLTLVAAGKTNRRISAELVVSLGTVKTHLNNLYRKLEVHSRTQAVARARALNVL